MRRSPSIEDVTESSRSRSRKGKKMKKFGKWIKAIFTTCTYAARMAYEDQLEDQKANWVAREHVGLPPLPPARSLLRFDDLPSLSDTDTKEDKEEEEE